MSLLDSARLFAVAAHAGQKYGKYPYTEHLAQAANVLKGFITNQEILCAVYLHDTLEDSKVSRILLEQHFGEDIAGLVYAVTDELGRNRKERHKKTYPKILNAGWKAVAVKLADRIANLRHSMDEKYESKIKMYVEEHAEFKKALHRKDMTIEVKGLKDMWNHLDRLVEEAR